MTPNGIASTTAMMVDRIASSRLSANRSLISSRIGAPVHDGAGHHAHEKEDEHRDADQRRDHQEDAFDDVFGHARWQAALCPGVRSRRSGMSYLQRSMAIGQRGWNTHPAGGLSGLGT